MDTEKKLNACLAMLRRIQWDFDNNCCVECGGGQHHDTACELGALLSEETARSYKRETGSEAVDMILFQDSLDAEAERKATEEAQIEAYHEYLRSIGEEV